MAKQQLLLVQKRGETDWVTLNRPDKLYALNEELVEALAHGAACGGALLARRGPQFKDL